MCHIHGSIEQATSICPMCKVFKPSASRCPHTREVCSNRQLHPQHDIVCLTNAEVTTFNGCGFCKWARQNPSLKGAGYPNPGWPGCCRPPNVSENFFIPPADWAAVTIVHRVPAPQKIKELLAMAAGPPRERGSSQPSPRNASSVLTTPPKASVALAKQPTPLAIPTKTRSGSSPKQPAAPLTRESRGASGATVPSPVAPPADLRRATSARESSPGSKPASLRKAPDQDSTIGRRSTSQKRPPTASALALSLSQVTLDERPGIKRRSSATPNGKSASPPSTRLVDVMNTPAVATRTPKRSPSQENLKPRRSTLEAPTPTKTTSRPIPSGGSDGSSSSSALSESTVTSEGFTDYLSDESEAELQKQAEVKAAQVAQNIMEEQEFKAARKELAHVGLAPPKTWNSATVGRHAGKDVGYAGGNYQSRTAINVMDLARSK